jgi:hypothetical protein
MDHGQRRSHRREAGFGVVGVILVCLVSLTLAACDGETERTSEGKGAASAQRETRGSDAVWEAFKATAEHDLDVLVSQMERARASLAEAERAKVDHWTARVKDIREEMSKEYAGAAESRERYRERLKGEIKEMVDEARALLAKLSTAVIPSWKDEPAE